MSELHKGRVVPVTIIIERMKDFFFGHDRVRSSVVTGLNNLPITQPGHNYFILSTKRSSECLLEKPVSNLTYFLEFRSLLINGKGFQIMPPFPGQYDQSFCGF